MRYVISAATRELMLAMSKQRSLFECGLFENSSPSKRQRLEQVLHEQACDNVETVELLQ